MAFLCLMVQEPKTCEWRGYGVGGYHSRWHWSGYEAASRMDSGGCISTHQDAYLEIPEDPHTT